MFGTRLARSKVRESPETNEYQNNSVNQMHAFIEGNETEEDGLKTLD